EALGTYDYFYITGPDTGNWGFKANLNYELTETTNLYVRGEDKYGVDITAHLMQHWLVLGGVEQVLGARTTAKVEGHYDGFRVPFYFAQDDSIWGVTPQLTYQLTDHLSLRAIYEYNQNIGPYHFNDFVDHRGTIGATYNFGELLRIH